MAWLQIHQSLPTHRKTMLVADTLDIRPVQVVGHLASFWLWAIDNAPTGQLTGVTEKTIARAAQWDGDSHVFVSTLRSARFLDGDDILSIHDWAEYTGRLIAKRNANTERMRRERATHVQRTDDARAGARVEKSREENKHLRGAKAPQTPISNGSRSGVPAEKVKPLFSVLVKRCGYEIDRLTKNERGELNKAAVDLATVEYTAADVNLMCDNYPAHFDGCLMTPSAIAKHASRLRQRPTKASNNGGPNYRTAAEAVRDNPDYA